MVRQCLEVSAEVIGGEDDQDAEGIASWRRSRNNLWASTAAAGG